MAAVGSSEVAVYDTMSSKTTRSFLARTIKFPSAAAGQQVLCWMKTQIVCMC